MPYVPDTVIESGAWESLNGTESKVYVILCHHYNRKDRISFPGMTRIAKMCRTSRTHVARTIKSLCEKGMIVKFKKESPYGGKDFNYYLMPDFLLYEYEVLKKDPLKNALEIVEVTNVLMKAMSSINLILGSIKKRPMRTKKAPEIVSNPHPNYIMNHINIINSFNKPSGKKPKTKTDTNRFLEHGKIPQPFSDPLHDVMREQFVKPLLEKLGSNQSKSRGAPSTAG